MIKKLVLLAFTAAFLLNACKKSDDSVTLPSELATVKKNLKLSLDSLESQLTSATGTLAQSWNDTSAIRNLLIQLYSGSSFSKEIAFINAQYIMQQVEPPEFYQFQGTDFSSSTSLVEALASKQPCLTSQFAAVEGFNAVIDIHPILAGGIVKGAIESLYTPEEILGRIILPVIQNQAFDIWVMEKDGVEIYDQDTSTVGHNIFTDPIYDPFPSLRTAAHLMSGKASGNTTYTFYLPGTTTAVKKDCYWDTFTIHGMEWKIVWVKPL